ncbi:MAG: hypothetical protein RTU92_11825, partial [Candidatus Thorarchaeota archaeon]
MTDDKDGYYPEERGEQRSIMDYDLKALLAFVMVAGSAFVIIVWMPQYVMLADFYAGFGYTPEPIV